MYVKYLYRQLVGNNQYCSAGVVRAPLFVSCVATTDMVDVAGWQAIAGDEVAL